MAFNARRETVTIRDAALIYRNFAGEKGQYNAGGDRNFSVMMGEIDGIQMGKDGWNVKQMKRREEDDQNLYHLKVKVNFVNRPPRCWLVTSAGRTMLGEGLIAMFDQLDYTKVDLVIAPYNWEMGGQSGRTAYLETMFFHVYENELEKEYSDVPQIGSAGDGPPLALEGSSNIVVEGEIIENDVRR